MPRISVRLLFSDVAKYKSQRAFCEFHVIMDMLIFIVLTMCTGATKLKNFK